MSIQKMYADERTVIGLRHLPISWFYFCLAVVGVFWVLSIAELICLFQGGTLK